jgi:hypothetical protein
VKKILKEQEQRDGIIAAICAGLAIQHFILKTYVGFQQIYQVKHQSVHSMDLDVFTCIQLSLLSLLIIQVLQHSLLMA